MSPQEKFNAMVTAMIGGDEWVALVEDDIAREDAKLLASCSWLTVSQREALAAKFAA